ncbi:MAG: NAD(+) synthase [Mycoplasmataceae bacterium]|nr:NAD(+) synthase [Mycoplasmataceae bacterium]
MLNIEKRVKWLQKKVNDAGAKGLIVAISGGIDSAVVAALSKKAFPNNTFGIFLEINSSITSKRNFLRTINSLDIEEKVINLNESFDLFLKDVFEISNPYKTLKIHEKYIKTGIAPVDKTYLNIKNLKSIKGNIKARLRMTAIYAHAEKLNYLVLETSNLSEMIIGYYTKWGDGVGDLAPISDLYKREVYELAKELKIPKIILNSKPSADLWKGQTDEEEMGFTYDQLEYYNKGRKIPLNKEEIIKKLIKRNLHKNDGVYKFKNEK